MQNQAVAPRLAVPPSPLRFFDRPFYFGMSLLTCAVVIYGFSHTVQRNLINPAVPRPFVLYIHAAVFTAWLGFFLLQSALVRTRNVRWHRRMGWLGLALGIAVLIVGVTTALTMMRFNRDVLHSAGQEMFLMVPLYDMLCFAVTFALAIRWRNKPEYHRRLMLLATCALTAAGWGRFPQLPRGTFYLGVDFLIILGIARDLIVTRTIHPVYRYALPLFAAGQAVVITTIIRNMTYWQSIAHRLVG